MQALCSLATLGALLAAASAEPGATLAAGVDYAVQAWTIRDGLPQNEVTALEQTPDGDLWIGTFGGLVRFDGLAFEVVDLEREPGLRSNRVVELEATRDGSLYVGTEDAGLVRRFTGRFEPVPGESLGPNVHCLLEDSEGNLWVGGAAGLSRVRAGRLVEHIELDAVHDVVEAPRGTLWIATDHGLVRRRGLRTEVLSADPRFVALAALEDGSVLAGLHGDRHVERWRGDRSERLPLPSATRVRAMLEDGSGGLWIGDAPWIRRGDRYEEPLRGHPLSGVRALLEDREGSIWIGGPEGLHRLRPTPLRGHPLPPALRAPWIVAAEGGAPGTLWVALYSGRVLRFEDGSYQPLPGVVASAFAPSRDGSVWVADRTAGVGRLRAGTFELAVPEEVLRPWDGAAALLEDGAGDLWFGADARLGRLRGERLETFGVAQGLPPHEVLVLLEARQGERLASELALDARFAQAQLFGENGIRDALCLQVPLELGHEQADLGHFARPPGRNRCQSRVRVAKIATE